MRPGGNHGVLCGTVFTDREVPVTTSLAGGGEVPARIASQRAEQRKLREQMLGLGLCRAEIAAEMARRHKLRPRAAWRTAWGWTLEEAAERYNAVRARDTGEAV